MTDYSERREDGAEIERIYARPWGLCSSCRVHTEVRRTIRAIQIAETHVWCIR